jgi:hypothetical protein
MDKRLTDLRRFVKETSTPIGEIIHGKRMLIRFLTSLGYARRTAENLAYTFFVGDTFFRVGVERWVKVRRGSHRRNAERINLTVNRKRFTMKMKTALKLQEEDHMTVKEIGKAMGVSVNCAKHFLVKGRKRRELEKTLKGTDYQDGINPMRSSSYIS